MIRLIDPEAPIDSAFISFVHVSQVHNSALTALLSTGHTFLSASPVHRRQLMRCV